MEMYMFYSSPFLFTASCSQGMVITYFEHIILKSFVLISVSFYIFIDRDYLCLEFLLQINLINYSYLKVCSFDSAALLQNVVKSQLN